MITKVRELIAATKSAQPQATLHLSTIPHREGNTANLNTDIENFNAQLHSVCAQEDSVRVVDIHSALKGSSKRPVLDKDGIHLTNWGTIQVAMCLRGTPQDNSPAMPPPPRTRPPKKFTSNKVTARTSYAQAAKPNHVYPEQMASTPGENRDLASPAARPSPNYSSMPSTTAQQTWPRCDSSPPFFPNPFQIMNHMNPWQMWNPLFMTGQAGRHSGMC